MEFHPTIEEAAKRLSHTPRSAASASLDRALVELLHAELHLQLDEKTFKEVPGDLIFEVRKALESLKGCSAFLKQQIMVSKVKSRYGWSSDPTTDRELQEKYGDSIHKPKEGQ